MLAIALSLLGGLILSWFGFDHTVIQGMKEVFDVTISQTGYFFLFGLLGACRSIGVSFRSGVKVEAKDKKDANTLAKEFSKTLKTKGFK